MTETSRYLANPPPARYATQSGPMLIIDGKVHPKIRPDGTSQKIRNGVGACKGGAVTFAIADDPVTFDTFARLFRDGLGCQNALFLDGSVSSLYAPELNRDDELGAARADCRRRAAGRGGEEPIVAVTRLRMLIRRLLATRAASLQDWRVDPACRT